MSEVYRMPERGVDETEIERAKIHEAAETKRKAIEETEKTKRARLEEWSIGPLVLTGVAMIAGAILAGKLGSDYIEAKHPKPPTIESCVEIVEVIGRSSDPRKCPLGHIETKKLNENDIEWRCVCSPGPRGDGGTP